ncbi:MAG TPA: hypothetical protein VJ792_08735 [Candidatus Nitrosotalea sp.]|nr:hypothetical protein [Candidatus Nitrosotalea sp.]
MSNPEENKDKAPDNAPSGSESPENLFKMLDDLLSHTNSSRRIFLIFIASALIFAPVALVMGGILIGHPRYSVFRLESNHEEFGGPMMQGGFTPQNGTQMYLVEKMGNTTVREMQFHAPLRPLHQDIPIFIGIQVFIFICIAFAALLLYVALKEYRFFAKWNVRYKKYKATQDKIDDELGKD